MIYFVRFYSTYEAVDICLLAGRVRSTCEDNMIVYSQVERTRPARLIRFYSQVEHVRPARII